MRAAPAGAAKFSHVLFPDTKVSRQRKPLQCCPARKLVKAVMSRGNLLSKLNRLASAAPREAAVAKVNRASPDDLPGFIDDDVEATVV